MKEIFCVRRNLVVEEKFANEILAVGHSIYVDELFPIGI